MLLLPPEEALQPAIDAIAAAQARGSHSEVDRITVEMLRRHPLCKSTQRPPAPKGALPPGVVVEQQELQLDVSRFGKWLRTPEGRPWLAIGKGPSDDGLYTVSQLLRTYMPRGLSWFEVTEDGRMATLAVRGFKKFTGLQATDEDEESGATEQTGLFLYGHSIADASRIVVTVKSNGENGKWALRRSPSGHLLCFAGSKHATRVWSADVDPRPLYPLPEAPAYVPADTIVHAMHSILKGMDATTRASFEEIVVSNEYTLMLEYNHRNMEHVFPIDEDFVDFVAVLDRQGIPISQADAFTFFDRFGLPHVECTAHPASELDAVVEEVRARQDNEGAVVYLEDNTGECLGLLKIKSDHYVIARRVRQTFWGGLINPLLQGKLSDSGVGLTPSDKAKGTTIAEALAETERRLRKGMRALTHVRNCNDEWQGWFERARLFVNDWLLQYQHQQGHKAKLEFAEQSKRKFGTLYASFLRKFDSPQYVKAQGERAAAMAALHGHESWAALQGLLEEQRHCFAAIDGIEQALAGRDSNKKGKKQGKHKMLSEKKKEALEHRLCSLQEEAKILEAKVAATKEVIGTPLWAELERTEAAAMRAFV
jgi:hypothetical protein